MNLRLSTSGFFAAGTGENVSRTGNKGTFRLIYGDRCSPRFLARLFLFLEPLVYELASLAYLSQQAHVLLRGGGARTGAQVGPVRAL